VWALEKQSRKRKSRRYRRLRFRLVRRVERLRVRVWIPNEGEEAAEDEDEISGLEKEAVLETGRRAKIVWKAVRRRG
jgi:hypothetical protein